MMLRLSLVPIALVLSAILPAVSFAEEVDITGSNFTFTHAPVDPTAPDGICLDPPGLLFDVTDGSFDGLLLAENASFPFVGSGDASGCVYMAPIDGAIGVFTGSFTWVTPAGEIDGTFQLTDFPTYVEGVLVEGVFLVDISIEFVGGTGRFKNATGTATAQGLDFPFGWLPGISSTAGVVAKVTSGEIKLKKR